MPVTRVSSGGADFIHWSGGGEQLHWSIGPTVYTAAANDLFACGAAAGENARRSSSRRRPACRSAMEVAADRPRGTVALTGARHRHHGRRPTAASSTTA